MLKVALRAVVVYHLRATGQAAVLESVSLGRNTQFAKPRLVTLQPLRAAGKALHFRAIGAVLA